MPVLVPYVANTSRLADLLRWYGESQARSRERLGEIQAGLWSQLGKIGSQAILDIGEQRRTAAKEAEQARLREEENRRENERLRLAQEADRRQAEEVASRLRSQQLQQEETALQLERQKQEQENTKRAEELMASLSHENAQFIDPEAWLTLMRGQPVGVVEKLTSLANNINKTYKDLYERKIERERAATQIIQDSALAAYVANDPRIFVQQLQDAVNNGLITQSHSEEALNRLNPDNFHQSMLSAMGPKHLMDVQNLEVSKGNLEVAKGNLAVRWAEHERQKEIDDKSIMSEADVAPLVSNYITLNQLPRFTGKYGQVNFRTFARALAQKVSEGAQLPAQAQARLKPLLNSLNNMERFTNQVEAYEQKVLADIEALKRIARGESPDGRKIFSPVKEFGNQWMNKPVREIAARMGRTTEQDFLAQLEAVKSEVARVLYSSPLSAGAIPVASMKKMDEMLPKSLTVKQLMSSIDRVVIPDVRRRVEFLREQINKTREEFDRAMAEALYGQATPKVPDVGGLMKMLPIPQVSGQAKAGASGSSSDKSDKVVGRFVKVGEDKDGKPIIRFQPR
jgi:hypothetical protein